MEHRQAGLSGWLSVRKIESRVGSDRGYLLSEPSRFIAGPESVCEWVECLRVALVP